MAELVTEKMGVLVNSLAGGGAEKVVATLYPEFQKANARVSLICLEKNNFYQIDNVSPNYLSSHTGNDEGGVKKLASLFSHAFKLKRYVATNRVSLVQSHIYRSNYVNVLARLLGAQHKTQIVNHGMPAQYQHQGWSGKINQALIKCLYPKADQVICPSQGMIDQIMELGVRKEKLQLIHNPFDLEKLRTMAKCSMDDGELEFDSQKKYVISIGRLQAVKRMEDVVRAFFELQKEMKSAELVILGDGDKRGFIQALISQLGIGMKVHMPGQLKNPYKYLARADILVSASAYEGFSNVIVEALAVGVPVISTDCECGPREILAPGTSREKPIPTGAVERVSHGLLVPVGDIYAMAKAMQQLLSDDALQSQLIRDGANRAQQFDKVTIAKQYAAHSQMVLGKEPWPGSP